MHRTHGSINMLPIVWIFVVLNSLVNGESTEMNNSSRIENTGGIGRCASIPVRPMTEADLVYANNRNGREKSAKKSRAFVRQRDRIARCKNAPRVAFGIRCLLIHVYGQNSSANVPAQKSRDTLPPVKRCHVYTCETVGRHCVVIRATYGAKMWRAADNIARSRFGPSPAAGGSSLEFCAEAKIIIRVTRETM